MTAHAGIFVISLGGSIVAPGAVDTAFLAAFKTLIEQVLAENNNQKYILVVGGGAPAREYQKAFCAVTGAASYDKDAAAQADWIGIMATRLNAQLVKAIFGKLCPDDVVVDPTKDGRFTGRILVAAGWKPGFSSDNDAVLLAQRFGAKTVINLSNIEKVYSADPKTDPHAKPLDHISWADFRAMVGTEWTPGKNVPFDPVASQCACEHGISVICAAGKNLDNLARIIEGKPFTGTVIGA